MDAEATERKRETGMQQMTHLASSDPWVTPLPYPMQARARETEMHAAVSWTSASELKSDACGPPLGKLWVGTWFVGGAERHTNW